MTTHTAPRSIRGHLNTTFWILDFYENQRIASPSTGWRRMLHKNSRERLRLIIRARLHGFDINETIYLLGLLDDARRKDRLAYRTTA